MIDVSWKDLRVSHILNFVMVSPVDLNASYGLLEGVDLTSSTIDQGYYTDDRISGSLKVYGEGWEPGSMIRVLHMIPELDYTREEGTFIVTNAPAERSNGVWSRTLELHSKLWGLAQEKPPELWKISKNAKYLKAFGNMLSTAGYTYLIDEDANDGTFTTTRLYDACESWQTRLFDLADLSGNRIEVDGHGRIVIEPYISPSLRSPEYRFHLHDSRGMVSDDLSLTTNFATAPGRTIVRYQYSDDDGTEHDIIGWADVQNEFSKNVRGYLVTDVQVVSELNPATEQKAIAVAKERLAQQSVEKIEWSVTVPYIPLHEGDVVELVIDDGYKRYQGQRLCMVKNLSWNLGDMTMRLTLKETSAPDEED